MTFVISNIAIYVSVRSQSSLLVIGALHVAQLVFFWLLVKQAIVIIGICLEGKI